MKRISLITNSNIQYYKFSAKIDEDFARNNTLVYYEPFDNNKLDFIYNPVYKARFRDDYIYLNRQELIDRNYLVNNKIKEDVDFESINKVSELETYQISSLRRTLKK